MYSILCCDLHNRDNVTLLLSVQHVDHNLYLFHQNWIVITLKCRQQSYWIYVLFATCVVCVFWFYLVFYSIVFYPTVFRFPLFIRVQFYSNLFCCFRFCSTLFFLFLDVIAAHATLPIHWLCFVFFSLLFFLCLFWLCPVVHFLLYWLNQKLIFDYLLTHLLTYFFISQFIVFLIYSTLAFFSYFRSCSGFTPSWIRLRHTGRLKKNNGPPRIKNKCSWSRSRCTE